MKSIVVKPARQTEALSRSHGGAGPHFRRWNAIDAATTLTVILPMYNEAGVVVRSIETVMEYAERHPAYRFVFVDDGSTDGTAAQLRSRLDEWGERAVSFLAMPRNVGKGRAIRSALALVGSKHVAFTDGDLAYSLDHLPVLEQALEAHEMVIGSRRLVSANQRNTVVSRRILGRAFNGLVRLTLGLPYRDTQAGIKGFRTGVARHLFSLQRVSGFGFDAELLVLARLHGYSVAEFPAHVDAGHDYETSKIKLCRNALRMFAEVVEVRRNVVAGRYR